MGGVSLARESLPVPATHSLVRPVCCVDNAMRDKVYPRVPPVGAVGFLAALHVASRSATPATALTSDLALPCQSSPIPAKVNLVKPRTRAFLPITSPPLGYNNIWFVQLPCVEVPDRPCMHPAAPAKTQLSAGSCNSPRAAKHCSAIFMKQASS